MVRLISLQIFKGFFSIDGSINELTLSLPLNQGLGAPNGRHIIGQLKRGIKKKREKSGNRKQAIRSGVLNYFVPSLLPIYSRQGSDQEDRQLSAVVLLLLWMVLNLGNPEKFPTLPSENIYISRNSHSLLISGNPMAASLLEISGVTVEKE